VLYGLNHVLYGLNHVLYGLNHVLYGLNLVSTLKQGENMVSPLHVRNGMEKVDFFVGATLMTPVSNSIFFVIFVRK
jgi:hypothetical protein